MSKALAPTAREKIAAAMRARWQDPMYRATVKAAQARPAVRAKMRAAFQRRIATSGEFLTAEQVAAIVSAIGAGRWPSDIAIEWHIGLRHVYAIAKKHDVQFCHPAASARRGRRGRRVSTDLNTAEVSA